MPLADNLLVRELKQKEDNRIEIGVLWARVKSPPRKAIIDWVRRKDALRVQEMQTEGPGRQTGICTETR